MTDVLEGLPRPGPNDRPNTDMWVDEQIWGHRLWDSQTPWLIFLEFLSVAEARHRDDQLFDSDERTRRLSFRPNKHLYLRNILFNNEEIFRIADRYPDNDAAWKIWLEWMHNNAQGVPEPDFSYLRSRFHEFHKFKSLVDTVRSSTIERASNKRWSSRFAFPFGTHSIYEDLNIRNRSVSREYINFGRPGELLYLMLSRSPQAADLKDHLAANIERRDKCDELLRLMQPDDIPDDLQHRGDCHLPYAAHPSFEALGADWLSIFRLNLPRFDAYPHLATLGAFHLILYQLVTAAHLCGDPNPPIVCEVVAPRKTLVRELSVMSYQKNNELPTRAVKEYVEELACNEAWLKAARDPSTFGTCLKLARDHAGWPKEGDYDGPTESDYLLDELRKEALRRHRQHVGGVHRSYGGGIGLVSRRGTNRLRYAPTDELLKTVILANVSRRMEYGQFLSLLFKRYGLVFGEREAQQSLKPEEIDKRAFQANSDRLESRLRTLGMLRKLSDACAYVENPLWRATA